MAVTVTKILDGARNAVFHVYIEHTTGEETDAVLIDPATSFDPAYPASPGMSLDAIWGDLTGFNARLEYDELASDRPVWSISGGSAFHVDFAAFGGLKDRSNPPDGSGKLMLTTSGLSAGDFGTLIVRVRKG